MKKIPTLFERDENNRKYVTSDINPECQWVIDGEGKPTRKIDGTCCLVRDGRLYKRYEVKQGKQVPVDFEPANEVDPNTGKQSGWLPVGDGPEDKYHREAWRSWQLTAEVEPNVSFPPTDGTYELVGPKIQGNAEGYSAHVLISHESETDFDTRTEPPNQRDYESIRKWMNAVAKPNNIEGIVWHHADGRMAKIKARDFPT